MKKSDMLSHVLLDGFQGEDSNPVNIKFILHQYLKWWWLFLIGIVVCVSLAMIYLFYATPQYSAFTSLLINIEKGIDYTKNAVFSDIEGYESSNKLENELEVLASYSLMRDAIEELPLHASFFIEDKYSRRREIYAAQAPIDVVIHEINTIPTKLPDDKSIRVRLNEDGFSMDLGEGNQRDFSYGEKIKNWYGVFSIEKKNPIEDDLLRDIIIYLNNKDQMAAGYVSSLDLKLPSRYASVVNLTLIDAVPERGKDVLNKLVEVYNSQAVREKNTIATNTIEFIDEQLATLTKELDGIEQKLEEYKRLNNISDLNSEMAFHAQGAGQYEGQLTRSQTQIEILESIENHLNSPSNFGRDVTSSLTIEDKTLAALVVRFNDLLSEKERMLRTSQPNNPLVVNIDEQLSTLKQNILSNLSSIKQGLLIENRNLRSMIAQYDSRAKEVPEIERGLLELSREQVVKQEHYLYLIKKREESQLSLAATTVSNSRIIDAASAGGAPVKPNKKMILALAFIMGMGIPFSIVYLKNTFTDKIVQKHDVTNITPIPVVAEITHKDNDDLLAISEKKRSPIAEQFRLLRTNLRFLNHELDDKVILVTSSISGEGKTFFSLNFAVSLSITGKKVVVLEFDLRKPALLDNLSIKRPSGITEYLTSDHVSIDDLLLDYAPISNLSLISCGSIPDDPAELMLSPKVGTLIDELKSRFDYVILDTAPVGTVADAFSLVPYTDYSLFVVRYNFTSKSHIRFTKEINLQKKLKRPMIIMNDAQLVASNYAYGYGYGYGDQKKAYS